MSFNVMGSADKKEQSNLIPKGTLLFCMVNVREKKTSQTGRGYWNLELKVTDNNMATGQPQPYAKKNIFEMISDPGDPDLQNVAQNGVGDLQKKAETTIEIAVRSLGCMAEFALGASPENPDSYNVSDDLKELHGTIVGVAVGIEKDKSGQPPDKNRVASFLSPNPNRQSHSGFKKLISGDHNVKEAAPAQQPGFGAAAPAPQAAQAGFGLAQPAQQQQAPPPASRCRCGGGARAGKLARQRAATEVRR